MPSLWTALSLSSSSSRKRPLKGKGKSKSSNNIFINSASNDQKRKLNRQRKLRHATDDEVGVNSSAADGKSQSWPVSPDSGSGPASGARTPQPAACDGHWSKSAVPQPLPRPEMNHHLPQTDCSRDPLPIARMHSPQIYGKTTDDIVRNNYLYPTYRRRGFPQELHLDTAANEFDLHFPARSAPSSGYSSPLLSPQKYRTVDLFRPSFQASSAWETLASDRISTSYKISPTPTPEHSPLHSPTNHGNTKNSNAVFVHSRNKPLVEGLAARLDANNVNVHPLPLPPSVSSRPSPTMRHSIDRLEFPSVKGQWQRGRPIGRGTYGNVYIATHRETGATCAVKEVEMIPDDPKCEECIKQLEQEIKFLRDFKHQNIVQYYGCEIIEDRFCIYLEYVHPGSINKYVQENSGAMTESIIRNFTRHILSGLAYLHSKKTIHRDIKGANLLVNASGVVKLADFGLAKHLTGGIYLSLKGTPHWMAPEVLQAVMRKDANPQMAYGVDIWSVGCTVVEMLTGKPPWGDVNGVQAMFNVLNKTPPIPENLSCEGKDFLLCCFQRRPEDRPSACELLKHPFLRSSQEHVSAGFVHEFSGLKLHKLTEVVDSSCDQTRRNKEMAPLSSVTRIQHGKLPLPSGETSRQSCFECSDTAVLPHHSPRSTLEVLPRISSAELSRCSNTSSPSNVENNVLLGAVNNNIYGFSCKGNITLHMPKMPERKKHSSSVEQEIS